MRLVSQPGIEHGPLAVKVQNLNSGWPRNSHPCYNSWSHCLISLLQSTYFQLFYLAVFLIIVSPDSYLYEYSGISFLPTLLNLQHPKCLALNRHSVKFCWMNEYTYTGLYTHICTYTHMGLVAHQQWCRYHKIQKCRISQSLQVRWVPDSNS